MFASRILLASERSAGAVTTVRSPTHKLVYRSSPLASRRNARPIKEKVSSPGPTWHAEKQLFSDSWLENQPAPAATAPTQKAKHPPKETSLAGRLFAANWSKDIPTATKAPISPARDVPLLPLDVLEVEQAKSPQETAGDVIKPSYTSTHQSAASPSTILHVRRASPNLTLADFRRLIPQSAHLEGWTSAAADILKVLPALKPRDLQHNHEYYLYFASPHSAKVFSSHVEKLSQFTAQYKPQKPFFEAAPDALIVDGIRVAAGIAALQVITGHQQLLIEHLNLPFPPALAQYIANEGHSRMKRRANKMPFELRLRLEGPEINEYHLRTALEKAGLDRGLSWTGRSDVRLVLDHYNRPQNDKVRNYAPDAPIYIVGFESDESRLSFMHYWHRRSLFEDKDKPRLLAGEVPPIVDLELLW